MTDPIDLEGISKEAEHCIELDGECLVCERCMISDIRHRGGWRILR